MVTTMKNVATLTGPATGIHDSAKEPAAVPGALLHYHLLALLPNVFR